MIDYYAVIVDVCRGEYRSDLALIFADKLHATNPTFNRDAFLTACGLLETGDYESPYQYIPVMLRKQAD